MASLSLDHRPKDVAAHDVQLRGFLDRELVRRVRGRFWGGVWNLDLVFFLESGRCFCNLKTTLEHGTRERAGQEKSYRLVTMGLDSFHGSLDRMQEIVCTSKPFGIVDFDLLQKLLGHIAFAET